MNPNKDSKFTGFKRIADVIENLIDAKLAKMNTQTYMRGVVDTASGKVAAVFIEGNATSTKGIPVLVPVAPGDKVMVVSIGVTGANLLVMGSLTSFGWTDAILQNGWVNYDSTYNTAQYCKVNGVVYLKGLIKSGTTGDNVVLFQLPAGCRPTGRYLYAAVSNNVIGRVDVDTSGNVMAMAPDSNAWISLDNIRIPTW
jgi:hypothetical protein